MFGDVADFEAAGCDVHLATLDGTAGVRGTVVDLLDSLAAGGKLGPAGGMRVATCGPDAMMAAVALDRGPRHPLRRFAGNADGVRHRHLLHVRRPDPR